MKNSLAKWGKHAQSIVRGAKDPGLGRWQAPDKGEVRPTPAFRLLRVGAELYVNDQKNVALSG
jgi:hypothetical protein